MNSSFVKAYKGFRKEAKATIVTRLVGALVYALIALAVSWVLPNYVARLSAMLPGYFFTGIEGTMYAYVLVTVFCLVIYRSFATKLSSYENVSDGRSYFAMSLGAKSSSLLLAKYLSAVIAPASVFVMGAALTLGLGAVLGISMTGVTTALLIAVSGLSMVLVFSALQVILGALGLKDVIITVLSVIFVFFIGAVWFVSGFLSVNDSVRIVRGAGAIGTPIAAAALVVLSAVICLTVPRKHLESYDVEDLDDDMLKQLAFNAELEVYEKQDDEFELLFAGKEILGDTEK